MSRKRKLERIVWHDANSPTGAVWFQRAEIDNRLVKVVSVGYVIHESKRAITLAAQVTAEGAFGGVITIPKVNISKRRTVA